MIDSHPILPGSNQPDPLRVLVSYFFGQGAIPLGSSCVRGLRALGCEVASFDSRVRSPVERYCLHYANKLLRGLGARHLDVVGSTQFGQ